MLLSEVLSISEERNNGLINDDSIKDWFYKNNQKRKYLNIQEKAIVLTLIEEFLQKDDKNSVVCVTNYVVKELIMLSVYLGVGFKEMDFKDINKNIVEIYESFLSSGLVDLIEEYSEKDIVRFNYLYSNFLSLETEMILREFINQINDIHIDDNMMSTMKDFLNDENFMKTLDMFNISQDAETKTVVKSISNMARKRANKK